MPYSLPKRDATARNVGNARWSGRRQFQHLLEVVIDPSLLVSRTRAVTVAATIVAALAAEWVDLLRPSAHTTIAPSTGLRKQ